MAKNTKWILAFIFLFILIPTIGTIRGRTQADIDGTPKRGSIASDEMQRNGNSNLSMISADGRFVTFQSYASNLVNGDTNHDCVTKDGLSGVNCPDVFVYDRDTTEMRRVSVSSNGAQGNSWSAGGGTISADGRYVAFPSAASNLVSGDTNKTYDVFVHDRETGQITSVSVSSVGMQGNRYSYQPFISASGRFVAYSSAASNLVPADTNELIDIFVHDREMGQTTRVSVSSDGGQANRHSYLPSISDDGRYVAFYSEATNLVSGDTNGAADVFVHDRETGQTRRVSVSSEGVQGNFDSKNPSISADGRFVAFTSDASNLVSGDTNGTYDIFVHDRFSGETTRVSVASDGTEANGKNFGSHYPYLTADGRYVTFGSFASNLVAGDTNGFVDIFVHDRETGETTRVSVSSTGVQGNSDSYSPSSISDDGRYVAFYSDASNLVVDDTNGCRDIFVHDRQSGQTERVSVEKGEPPALRPVSSEEDHSHSDS